jgi:tetratricopeptide (TPR) repeat protein
MKIKAVYLYIILFVVIVVGLILIDTSPENENSSVMPMATSQMPNDAVHNGEMPNDDIHKGLKGNSGPSKDDVLPQYYEHLDSLAQAWKTNQADTLLGLEYAHYLAAGHQTGKAISVYDQMIKRNPNSLSLREDAAYIAFKGGDYDLSEKYVKQILAKDKGNLDAKFNYGLIRLFKKDTLNAKKVWNEIVRNHPNSNEAERAKGALSNLK